MGNDVTRKLASVRRIAEIKKIDGADKIVAYRVDGWWVVDSVDKYQLNELVVYLEPDSWFPKHVAPFLCKAVKSFNGVEGERLRTVKLRGQLSQGLLLPMSVLPLAREITPATAVLWKSFVAWEAGDDVTEALGIQKYEKPLSPQLAGLAKGNFPSFLKKTDQERIQNLTREFEDWKARGLTFEVTEKLDGSSMTVFFKDGKVGVCSRNLELIEDDSNTFWKVAKKSCPMEGVDPSTCQEIAVQGELIGPGVQGNPYNRSEPYMFVFNVWDIQTGNYMEPVKCRGMANAFTELMGHVPVVAIRQKLPETIGEVLAMSDGISVLANVPREGLVWKCEQDPSISFKAISNKWLLKNE